jgi:hypothetical protein
MTKQVRWLIFFMVAFCVVTARTDAGSLLKLWEINLRDNIKEIEHSKIGLPTVFALRFSPDGQHIAVIIEEYHPGGGESPATHLLVVPVRHSNGSVRQFEVRAGAEDLGHTFGWSGFQWTAASDAIVVEGELLRLTDRKSCATLGSIVNSFAEEARIAQFLLRDNNCSANANWKFSNDWILNDISMERSLLCVSQPLHWGARELVAAETARIAGLSNEILVVDPFTGKILQRWPPSVIQGDVKFGDSGRVICGARTVEAGGRLALRCWDIDSGRQIAEAATINGGAPIAAATRASRAVASDFRRSGIPFTDSFKEVLRRRAVWDFKTGRELAFWKPELQPYDIGLEPVGREWSAFAISADGQYLAEGGNGILRFYKIEP